MPPLSFDILRFLTIVASISIMSLSVNVHIGIIAPVSIMARQPSNQSNWAKVVLQPNKQPVIWKTLCDTFAGKFDGDMRNFFREKKFEVSAIKEYIQKNKKLFPYLGGNKIRM